MPPDMAEAGFWKSRLGMRASPCGCGLFQRSRDPLDPLNKPMRDVAAKRAVCIGEGRVSTIRAKGNNVNKKRSTVSHGAKTPSRETAFRNVKRRFSARILSGRAIPK